MAVFTCRPGCGACCVAISISAPIPGMPRGKAAGARCIHLSKDNLCLLYGSSERPPVCNGLIPSEEMCGSTREEAMSYLQRLEELTKPDK